MSKYKSVLKVLPVLLVLVFITPHVSLAETEVSTSSIDVNIDSTVFSPVSIRLNTEIYDISESVINQSHLQQCYGSSDTPLFNSYKRTLTPLIPIALTINETGSWCDSNYTWTSAIYSKPIANAGVDMSELNVSRVNSDFYAVNGLSYYFGCKSNCTNNVKNHVHIVTGANDNDSLGPMQVLRRYIETQHGISYSCGATVVDLMSWQDNVNYFFHNQGDKFSSPTAWNRNHEIQNAYELVALMAVGHNTGISFMSAGSSKGAAGSYWNSAGSVYNYCSDITSESNLQILKSYVDEWYANTVQKVSAGEQFNLAGKINNTGGEVRSLMQQMGIDISNYASELGHKQTYPLLAVLNYMSLEKLYTSGDLQ